MLKKKKNKHQTNKKSHIKAQMREGQKLTAVLDGEENSEIWIGRFSGVAHKCKKQQGWKGLLKARQSNYIVSFALQTLPRWTESLTTINIPFPGTDCKTTRVITDSKLK